MKYFIDGDSPTGKECRFHCSPTCHPAQTGPDWQYGCTHPAWPQNRAHDFVPIVNCDGQPVKCDVKATKHWGRYVGGLKRRVNNATNKLDKLKQEMIEAESLLND